MKSVNIVLFLQGFGVSIQQTFFLYGKIKWTRNLQWIFQDEEMKGLQRTFNDKFIITQKYFDRKYIWNDMLSNQVKEITNVVLWVVLCRRNL